MSTKQARGTKRTCQSSECEARFYDLNRNPIVCPICGTVYELASSPLALAAADEKSSRRVRKSDAPSKVPTAEASDSDADSDDPLADIETEDGDDVAAEADETFLEEEEEEGGDVSGIIGGPVAEGDEEP